MNIKTYYNENIRVNHFYLCLIFFILFLYTKPTNGIMIFLSFLIVYFAFMLITDRFDISICFALLIVILLLINKNINIFNFEFRTNIEKFENDKSQNEKLIDDYEENKKDEENKDEDKDNDDDDDDDEDDNNDENTNDDDLFEKLDDSDSDEDSDLEINNEKFIKKKKQISEENENNLGKTVKSINTNNLYKDSQKKMYNLNRSMNELKKTLEHLEPALTKGESIIKKFKKFNLPNIGLE